MPRNPRRWAKLAGAALASLLLLALLLAVWLRAGAEDRLKRAVANRLDGSGFALQWQSLEIGWTGGARLTGLKLAEGPSALLEVAQIDARIAWLASLTGRPQLSSLLVQGPVVHLDLMDGQAVAWQRLRKALKRPGEEPPSESKGLLSRLGDVQVQDGQLRAKVLGKAVWLAGRDVDVVGITAALSADTVEISAQLPDVLGGGKAQAKGLLAQGKPAALEVQFVPLARYKAPELLRERLPKDLALQWAGARWDPKGGPAVTGLELIDLAEPATRILAVAAVSLPAQATAGEQRLEARDVELNAPKARLEQALKALMPQGLPAEATPIVAALDRTRAVLPQVTAVRRSQATGESWSIEILRSNGTLGDAAWSIASVTAAIGPKAEGVPREMKFAVDAPVLRVPRLSKLIRHPQLQAAIDQGVTLRKVAEPQPEFDDEDEELDPDIAPPPPKPKTAAVHPVAKPPRPEGERHPQRWTRQVKAGHAALLGLHKTLESRWFLYGWPKGTQLTVRDGRLELLGEADVALLGVRAGYLAVPGPGGPVKVAAEPFDRIGSWGRLAVEWQRRGPQVALAKKPAARDAAVDHHLQLHLSGGGIAQLLGSRLPGASVGDGAELQLYADVTVSERDLRLDGRLDMQRMGIQWWRLADRPIADFGMSLTFEGLVTPGSLVVRSPDIRLGQAWMTASLELLGLQGNPKVALNLDAPMQDCGAMLASVPPSMIPTLGSVQAHGAMSWHVGLTVPLPAVGAASVELALGDTPCVIDKLGDLDLTELQRKDWVRPVNENGKILDDVLIGPGSGSWTPLNTMPSYTPYVMWASEDSFLKHRGISEALLGKAIAIDLSTGRFTYGGSTITQQLVKNLYLKRTKALSRKFEEMIIVWQMERLLGKMKILEIYLNAVEFGPKVYGITRAAYEFFQKRPGELRPKEATYLAIIKPSPRSGWGTMRAGGWGDWYEMKCGKYMDKLHVESIVSDEDYKRDFEEFGNWRPAWNPPARGAKGGK